jgi:lysozyme
MRRVMLLLVAAMTAATTAVPAAPDANPTAVAVVTVPPEILVAKPDPDPAMKALVEMLMRDEGLRLKLYRDSKGIFTVGYGRNMRDRGITQSEALYLLNNDIAACQGELDGNVAWWRLLNAQRQMAMLSLCINLGIYGLLDFKGTLKAMEAGHYGQAALRLLDSKWAGQVGHRAQRIAKLIDPERAPEKRGATAGSRCQRGKCPAPVGRRGRRLQ